jgi:hypothetical protein
MPGCDGVSELRGADVVAMPTPADLATEAGKPGRSAQWTKHETLLDPDDVAAGHVIR